MASKKSGSVQEQPKTDGAENAPVYTKLFVRLLGTRTIGKASPRKFVVDAIVPVLVDGKVDELILRTAVRTVPQIAEIHIFDNPEDPTATLLQSGKVNSNQTAWEFTDGETTHKVNVKSDPKRWYRASVRGIIAGIRILAPAAKGGGGRSVAPLDPEVEAYIEGLDPATRKAIGSYIRRQGKKGASDLTVQDKDAMPSLDARRATETE